MDNGRFECELARDLMPLAADGQAGRESVGFLEEHINVCESCRKEYELMRGDLPAGMNTGRVSGRKGLSTGTKLTLAAAVYAAAVIILLILLYYKLTYMLF